MVCLPHKVVNSSRNIFLGLSAGGVLRPSKVSLEVEEFRGNVVRWCFALAKVASAAIPSSPAGAAKAGMAGQRWSSQRLLFLLTPPAHSSSSSSPAFLRAAASPGGNVRHAAAPLLFPPPAGIRTVTWPHTSTPPPAPNQSTKVLPNPAGFLCTHFPALRSAPPAGRHLNSTPVLLSWQTWRQNDVN